MLGLIRRYKEKREWARSTARQLVENHGHEARSMIRQRMIELTRQRSDTSLESLVKCEVDLLLGIKPRVDTATRYLDDHR